MMLKEAAERLGVSPSTLRVQLMRGKLNATKRGRDWWILPSEVDRYAAESGRQVNRCPARHPFGDPFFDARCDLDTGHPGEHVNSRYMRHWADDA
jgi:excisionase family DNA binding protein